ncbi:LysM peptidoglycan-binding domain-containing M23 family metallopeptidase [Candidatus Berkelbacteria bacterium]|nr:LysM peptidoglycan-binding domain-containing M23 family metallopeptidase [Candidatus Berkelbacteria bacterium]
MDKIAKQNGVNVATILETNGIAAKDITNIKAGTVLHIPPYNTSDSTAWLEETQKIAQAKLEAKQREEQKRKLVQAQRDNSINRAIGRHGVEKADVNFSGGGNECSINPVPGNLGISRGISGFHKGIDIRAPQGTPIISAKDGVVAEMSWERGFGNTILINVGGGETQRHGHLSSFADVSIGQSVSQGQVIGYVGSTGWSTGPHDHFEVRRNGAVINGLAC